MKEVLLLHGGAGFFKRSRQQEEALLRAAERGWEALQGKGALEGVLAAIVEMENSEHFNAGTGCAVQGDGKARMSASLMDGSRVRFAAVCNIEFVKNPVLVARELLGKPYTMLAGKEASAYARKIGFGYFNPVTEKRLRNFREWERKHKNQGYDMDTVGALALDKRGRLVAGSSTGGRGFEIPGRVSDSCTVAGNFAGKKAAATCTGRGEDIVNACLAPRIVLAAEGGKGLEQAVGRAKTILRKEKGRAAFIALDAKGNSAWGKTTKELLAARVLEGEAEILRI